MSRDLLELALWELSVDRHARSQFATDEAGWLARAGLDAAEVDAIARRDVATLAGLGVNPMLTMGFWMEQVGPDLLAYRDALRRGRPEGDG